MEMENFILKVLKWNNALVLLFPQTKQCRNPSKSLSDSIALKSQWWTERRKEKFCVFLGSNIARSTRQSSMCPGITWGSVPAWVERWISLSWSSLKQALSVRGSSRCPRPCSRWVFPVTGNIWACDPHAQLVTGCSFLSSREDLLLPGACSHTWLRDQGSEHGCSCFQTSQVWDYCLQIVVAWSPICCHHLGFGFC